MLGALHFLFMVCSSSPEIPIADGYSSNATETGSDVNPTWLFISQGHQSTRAEGGLLLPSTEICFLSIMGQFHG